MVERRGRAGRLSRSASRARAAPRGLVGARQTEAEVERLRESLRRGRPFGDLGWLAKAAHQLGLEASLRPRGRPRKIAAPQASLFDLDTDA